MSEVTKDYRGSNPYQDEEELPKQLELFNRELRSYEPDELKELRNAMVHCRAPKELSSAKVWANAISSFSVLPTHSFYKHLRKIKHARSSQEALSSDWTKVFQDVYISYLENAEEVERGER